MAFLQILTRWWRRCLAVILVIGVMIVIGVIGRVIGFCFGTRNQFKNFLESKKKMDFKT